MNFAHLAARLDQIAPFHVMELAKSFGGIDGHKYVNGVLDKFSAKVRRLEIDAVRQG